MHLTVGEDPAGFLSLVRPYLEAREAAHNTILGLLEAAARRATGPLPFMACVQHDDGTVASVAFARERRFVITGADDIGLEPIIQALRDRRIDPLAVSGPCRTAESFARRWSALRGCRSSLAHEQRIYEAFRIETPVGIPGTARLVHEADLPRYERWICEFHREALPNESFIPAEARESARARLESGNGYVWEVDGTIVSMAALARPTRNGIALLGVYTPLEHRGHGYATALSAHVSQAGLERGKRFCTLYADKANPTSNAIYQRIGYRPIEEARIYHFEYAAQRAPESAEGGASAQGGEP